MYKMNGRKLLEPNLNRHCCAQYFEKKSEIHSCIYWRFVKHTFNQRHGEHHCILRFIISCLFVVTEKVTLRSWGLIWTHQKLAKLLTSLVWSPHAFSAILHCNGEMMAWSERICVWTAETSHIKAVLGATVTLESSGMNSVHDRKPKSARRRSACPAEAERSETKVSSAFLHGISNRIDLLEQPYSVWLQIWCVFTVSQKKKG